MSASIGPNPVEVDLMLSDPGRIKKVGIGRKRHDFSACGTPEMDEMPAWRREESPTAHRDHARSRTARTLARRDSCVAVRRLLGRWRTTRLASEAAHITAVVVADPPVPRWRSQPADMGLRDGRNVPSLVSADVSPNIGETCPQWSKWRRRRPNSGPMVTNAPNPGDFDGET